MWLAHVRMLELTRTLINACIIHLRTLVLYHPAGLFTYIGSYAWQQGGWQQQGLCGGLQGLHTGLERHIRAACKCE